MNTGPSMGPEVSVYFKVGRSLAGRDILLVRLFISGPLPSTTDGGGTKTIPRRALLCRLVLRLLFGNVCPFTSLLVSSASSAPTSDHLGDYSYGAINM